MLSMNVCPSVHIFLLQRGTPPKEATEKENNQPHIVLFKDQDEDTDGAMNQSFICFE